MRLRSPVGAAEGCDLLILFTAKTPAGIRLAFRPTPAETGW
jgi:hypothetical protein